MKFVLKGESTRTEVSERWHIMATDWQNSNRVLGTQCNTRLWFLLLVESVGEIY